MILSPSDSQLVYKLMWGLQLYINAQKGIHKNIASVDEYAKLPTEKKAKVREALWKHPELIEAYIQENHHTLSMDELDILLKWRSHFVNDTFFILRHLKKGTIFISNKNQVYSVVGLTTELDVIIPSYALPHMVKAVLLPFKGNIIYDGILPGYNIIIGGGIRAEINRTYAIAKEKGRTFTTLEPNLTASKQTKPKRAPDMLQKLEGLASTAKALKGETSLQNAGLALIRASLDLTIAAARNEDHQPGERNVRRATTRLFNLLEIIEEE